MTLLQILPIARLPRQPCSARVGMAVFVGLGEKKKQLCAPDATTNQIFLCQGPDERHSYSSPSRGGKNSHP